MAAIRQLLVLVKRSAYDMYIGQHNDTHLQSLLRENHPSLRLLLDRHRVHEATIATCAEVFIRSGVRWERKWRDELQGAISGVDLVVTIGGDGTLLEASHHLDHRIPVLGVNSDPTSQTEVDRQLSAFDATRSRGQLCGASAETIGEAMADILSGRVRPSELARIATSINGQLALPPALNDVLLAHPNPAAVSRFTFQIRPPSAAASLDVKDDVAAAPLVHSRSSGLRVCSATGSTAAMQSSGGYPMDRSSRELQYMVREPMDPHPSQRHLMHGRVREGAALRVLWGNRQGRAYVDGSHRCHDVRLGEEIEFSSNAPPLRIFL